MTDSIDVLEKLIETCRDGQEGYRDAAQHVKDPQLKGWFNEQSLERARFAGELENHVQRLGKSDPDRKGSVSAALHRKWFELKEKFSSASDLAVLEEVERGEDNAKHNYQDALRGELPADMREIVQRQSESVFAAHDRVRDLRNALKSAA